MSISSSGRIRNHFVIELGHQTFAANRIADNVGGITRLESDNLLTQKRYVILECAIGCFVGRVDPPCKKGIVSVVEAEPVLQRVSEFLRCTRRAIGQKLLHIARAIGFKRLSRLVDLLLELS